MRRWLLLIMVVAWMSACRNDGGVGPLSLSPGAVNLWSLGQTVQLRLYETVDGQRRALTAERWQSEDHTVATVDGQGQVTAQGVGQTRVLAWYGGRSAAVTVTVDTDGLPLTGRISYPDPLYDIGGFTGATRAQPLRHARLEVLDEADQVRASGYTDDDGYFDLGRVVPEGLRLLVYSEADGNSGYPISVRDPGQGALYALALPLDQTTTPIDWRLDGPPLGAFHILAVLMQGWDFMAALTPSPLGPLAAYWAPSGSTGTFYCTGAAGQCPQGRGIYVLESLADSDAFDDDVLWHEFGHFVSDQLSRDSSPGGCHYLESLDLDLRLAWSEGWGDFLPAAVKDWLEGVRPGSTSLSGTVPTSIYVDTDGRAAAVLSFDVGDFPASYRYASNELAVAGILWRLRGRYGMDALWRVIEDYLPIAQGPVNLETLWNGWLVTHPPGGGLSGLEAVFAERDVLYRDDAYEDDEAAPRAVVLGADEDHTLYGVGDVDVVTLDLAAGQSVLIYTTGLTNGADTQLRVFDPDGLLVGDNDDADPVGNPYEAYDPLCGTIRPMNDGTRLASRVLLSAAKSGTYRIEVSSTLDPEPYPSAGRYGGYRLRVTTP